MACVISNLSSQQQPCEAVQASELSLEHVTRSRSSHGPGGHAPGLWRSTLEYYCSGFLMISGVSLLWREVKQWISHLSHASHSLLVLLLFTYFYIYLRWRCCSVTSLCILVQNGRESPAPRHWPGLSSFPSGSFLAPDVWGKPSFKMGHLGIELKLLATGLSARPCLFSHSAPPPSSQWEVDKSYKGKERCQREASPVLAFPFPHSSKVRSPLPDCLHWAAQIKQIPSSLRHSPPTVPQQTHQAFLTHLLLGSLRKKGGRGGLWQLQSA